MLPKNQIIDHDKAIIEISDIVNSMSIIYNSDVIKVIGPAGSGKTELLIQLYKRLNKRQFNIAFLAYTGKAVVNMASRAKDLHISPLNFSTIHRFLYQPIYGLDEKGNKIIVGWSRRTMIAKEYDILLIDEGSMIPLDIYSDLLGLHNIKIIVGDVNQLPPIDDTKAEYQFSAIEPPNYILSGNYRHEDSTIIKLSKFIIDNGYIPKDTMFSKHVISIDIRHDIAKKIIGDINHDSDNHVMLCGYNKTKLMMTKNIRSKLSYKSEDVPYPGEKIICLKNNYHTGLMNGSIGKLLWLMPDMDDLFTYDADFSSFGFKNIYTNKCTLDAFGHNPLPYYETKKNYDLLDFGYIITVHKSQGSEWETIYFLDDGFGMKDEEFRRRFLYTAVTRAKKKLVILH